MSTFINLSIIILNHRADQRLEESLQSSQFADEIIVIDNNSQADWDTLTQQYRFRVIPYPDVLVDWSAIRNQALTHAVHDWVFFLDSDEIIDSTAVLAIDRLIKSSFFAGGLIQRTDIFHGKQLRYGEAGNKPLIRIGKKHRLRFERPVHEEAIITGPVSAEGISVFHHAHLSIDEFFQKISSYAFREAQHRSQQGTSLFLPSIIIFPLGKFLFNIVFKLGLLDGWRGLIYAYMMSLHSFFVRVYQYELQHRLGEKSI
jgi:glycosyltransferase involved in cell wall biosynthesis